MTKIFSPRTQSADEPAIRPNREVTVRKHFDACGQVIGAMEQPQLNGPTQKRIREEIQQ